MFPLLKTVNTNLISLQEETIIYLSLKTTFPIEMANLKNKKKLATLHKENCEGHLWSNLAQNPNVPRSQGNYKTQISEGIKWRVTKKLSQELSRTENRILGALARLDDFLMNPLCQGHSGNAPETSRNIWHKPGNKWGRLPEWFSTWSGHLPQPDDAKLWPRRKPWHGDRSSRVGKLLLAQYIFREAGNEPLYKWTATLQWD